MSLKSLFAALISLHIVQNAQAQTAIPEIGGRYSCTKDGTAEVVQVTLKTEHNRLQIDGINWREQVSLALDAFPNGLPCDNAYFAGLDPAGSTGDTVEKYANCDNDSITVSSSLQKVTKTMLLSKTVQTFDFDFSARRTGSQSFSLSFQSVLKTNATVRSQARLLLECSRN